MTLRRRAQGVLDTDYTGWSFSTWVLYILAALYVVGFLWFWVRFEVAERRAKREGGAAVGRYNAMLQGFPNSVYAKMFGKQAFVVKGDEAAKPPT